MPARITKKQEPEDMLRRVIRVAEILVKGQDNKSEETTMKPQPDPSAVNVIRVQKTQT
jgi:hypothetical protein